MLQLPALIGGKPVTTTASVEIEDPSTGEIFALTTDCGPDEIDQAVKAAADAAKIWRRTSVPKRAASLRRLATLIERDLEELAVLESRQTGKPLRQARRDVQVAARYFDFNASAIETFYGSSFFLDENTHVITSWEPHGVTGHIIPWNYPLQMLGRSIAPALAMGNCAVLKPAEEAPLTALRIGDLALEAGIPEGVLNVVPGMGETAGAALSTHPGISHISFTGSVEVGRLIAHAAAQTLIPVTLELGGKSPNIVFDDADLDKTIPIVANSILQNAGQTCSAGSRLLVQRGVHAQVVDRIAELFRAVEIGPALSDPELGPVITGPQRDRVLSYAAIGKLEGEVRTGGGAPEGERFEHGFFVEPTLIDEIGPQDRLFHEEVFGPVLAVTEFSDLDEAVELANGTDYGLVAGVWTTNGSTGEQMIRAIETGQVYVNCYGASGGVELPFGGVKRSGYGREKGLEGLRGFAQLKTAGHLELRKSLGPVDNRPKVIAGSR